MNSWMGIIHLRVLLTPPCSYFGAALSCRCLPLFPTYASTNFRATFLALLIKHAVCITLKSRTLQGRDTISNKYWLKMSAVRKKTCSFASCMAWHSSGRGGRGQKKWMKPLVQVRLLSSSISTVHSISQELLYNNMDVKAPQKTTQPVQSWADFAGSWTSSAERKQLFWIFLLWSFCGDST